jgi:hypothetical protein
MRVWLLSALLSLTLLVGVAPAHAQRFGDLSPQERSVLQPLSADWDAMSATRKKKWLELAQRYPKLAPEEQQRLSGRMAGWSRMSPDDRRAARDQFREIQGPQNARPEAREQLKKQWDDYRNLPPEERTRLTQQNRAVAARSGAAESVKRAGTPPLPSAPASVAVVPQPPLPSRTAPQPK